MAKLLLLLLFLFSFGAAPSFSMTGGAQVELFFFNPLAIFRTLRLFAPAARRVTRWVAQRAAEVAAEGALEAALNRTRRQARSMGVDVQTPLYSSGGSFLMELAIGTPTVSYSAIMDTGTDFIWTQCQPCHQCFPQPTPLYDPRQSSTYAPVSCNSSDDCSYSYLYGDNSFTQGVFSTETFTFGSVAVPGVSFGCGNNNSGDFDNSSGIVGMGRGSLSLVSQLGVRRFSYCLTSYNDTKRSTLFLGTMAKLSSQAQSTPFVANPPSFPTSYYLSLQGITVGETELSIPNTTFSIEEDGTGGMNIDSGIDVTVLADPAYGELKQAFESQMNLSAADGSAYGFDICFAYGGGAVDVPSLVFHFEGADMDLPPENYLVNVYDSTLSTSLLCVMVMRANFTLSIFGNFMQQNMHMLYDLAAGSGTLSFEAAQCDQL